MQQWVTLANCLSKSTCSCFKYELYDSSVKDCCALFVVTLYAVFFFVQEGYRTLCVAYKILSAEEYAQADAGLREARLALQDREERLMTVYNQVETGMSLIGATAVEDRWVRTQHSHRALILLFSNLAVVLLLPCLSCLSVTCLSKEISDYT